MIVKIIRYNMIKNFKQYKIFYVTAAIFFALLYSFISITDTSFLTQIKGIINYRRFSNNLKIPLLLITSALLYLVYFIVGYLYNERKKELAVQNIVGVPKTLLALIFTVEIMISLIAVLVLGVPFGLGLSQCIGCFIFASMQNAIAGFSFFASINALYLAIILYACIFIIVGGIFFLKIVYFKIIDHKSNQFNDNSVSLWYYRLQATLYTCFTVLIILYDVKLHSADYTIFKVLSAVAAIAIIMINIFISKLRFFKVIIILLNFTILVIGIKASGTIAIFDKSYFVISPVILSIVLVLLLINVIASFYIAIPECIALLKTTQYALYTANILPITTILFRSNRFYKMLTFITASMVIGIAALFNVGIAHDWIKNLAIKRIYCDIQLDYRYKDIKEYVDASKREALIHTVQQLLSNNNTSIKKAYHIHTYFIDDKDLYKRKRMDFPTICIKLSDFNALLDSIGETPVRLEAHTFALQSKRNAKLTEKDTALYINGQHLQLSQSYTFAIPNEMYNHYTDTLYVVPDTYLVKNALANSHYFVWTQDALDIKSAYDITSHLSSYTASLQYPDKSVRLKAASLVIAESRESALIMISILIYLGCIFLLFPLVVLSINMLEMRRFEGEVFQIIYYLGDTNEKKYRKMLLYTWFITPVLIAVVLWNVLELSWLRAYWTDISGLISLPAIVRFYGITGGTILVCYTLYFLLTKRQYLTNNQRECTVSASL